MIVWMMVLAMFSCVCSLYLNVLPEFKDIEASALTLYSAALSNFDLTIFNGLEGTHVRKDIALTIFIGYLATCAITLLNLLIAIYSNIYNTFEKKA